MLFKFCTCINLKSELSGSPHRAPLKAIELPEETKEIANAHVSPTSRSCNYVGDGGDRVLNLDAGDPTIYETFWMKMGEKTTIQIPGCQSMSYYSKNHGKNMCWFLEPDLAKEIVRLHNVVGNAVTEGRYIVVGTGSSQLILAALFALSSPDSSQPNGVVSAVPYYSSYPTMSDYLKTSLFKWAGNATTFEKDDPYIELVTSPNNPDGSLRNAVVNRSGGKVVHDLAYYWPQYTPITSPADHDLSLFTVSKCSGHAGSRIGWALVKDLEVAKKMVKFIELNTIGVSKDSQIRAAKILSVISESCEEAGSTEYTESFYEFGHRLMSERWQRLRQAVKHSGMFVLPEFRSAHCSFLNRTTQCRPAFAWLKYEGEEEDCAGLLRRNKILARSGVNFGCSSKFVRVSMVDRDDNFDLFVQRISKINA